MGVGKPGDDWARGGIERHIFGVDFITAVGEEFTDRAKEGADRKIRVRMSRIMQ